jgi:hypothetical protein
MFLAMRDLVFPGGDSALESINNSPEAYTVGEQDISPLTASDTQLTTAESMLLFLFVLAFIRGVWVLVYSGRRLRRPNDWNGWTG